MPITLQVMKFGGTSLGNASRIEQAVDIVREALAESQIVIVVSAMSGVTNSLIHAANLSEAGEHQEVSAILRVLRSQHDSVAEALISSPTARKNTLAKICELFNEAAHLCQTTVDSRELTARTLDAIAGLGERLAAPLVAAALAERGITSEPIDSTELIVTTTDHGAAEPYMHLTRERCRSRLFPLLRQSIVPVITGFIGATRDGVTTTLGRNSSDYSATILGAALDANAVTIWSDVDGVLNADPRIIRHAATVSEISYLEAAELARFGAKVLHPKTFREVMHLDIPVWIRNTFAPECPGTKISSANSYPGVRALAAKCDLSLITVEGLRLDAISNLLARVYAVAVPFQTDVLPVSRTANSTNRLQFLVPSASYGHMIGSLHREFTPELKRGDLKDISIDPTIALVTLVGYTLERRTETVERAVAALSHGKVGVVAVAESSSCSVPLAIRKKDVEMALTILHREFQLSRMDLQAMSAECA